LYDKNLSLADWEVRGGKRKINPKWFGVYVTKGLITCRYRINQLIDVGKPRPLEINMDQWNTMVARRTSEVAMEKSKKMCSISKGKVAKAVQLQVIKTSVISKLVSFTNFLFVNKVCGVL